jgi:hypothetical protein
VVLRPRDEHRCPAWLQHVVTEQHDAVVAGVHDA